MRSVRVLGRVLAIAFAICAAGVVALWLSFGSVFILNATASEPVGVYVRLPGAIHRGDIVAGCLPRPLAMLGRHDGYLGGGPCPGSAPYVVKRVVGVAGDRASLSLYDVTVNGAAIPRSRRVRGTAAYLQAIQPQLYIVRNGEYWLASEAAAGWDSRYYGAVRLTQVTRVVLLR